MGPISVEKMSVVFDKRLEELIGVASGHEIDACRFAFKELTKTSCNIDEETIKNIEGRVTVLQFSDSVRAIASVSGEVLPEQINDLRNIILESLKSEDAPKGLAYVDAVRGAVGEVLEEVLDENKDRPSHHGVPITHREAVVTWDYRMALLRCYMDAMNEEEERTSRREQMPPDLIECMFVHRVRRLNGGHAMIVMSFFAKRVPNTDYVPERDDEKTDAEKMEVVSQMVDVMGAMLREGKSEHEIFDFAHKKIVEIKFGNNPTPEQAEDTRQWLMGRWPILSLACSLAARRDTRDA